MIIYSCYWMIGLISRQNTKKKHLRDRVILTQMPMRASQVLANMRVSAKIPTLVTAALGKDTINHSIEQIQVSIIAVMHLYSQLHTHAHVHTHAHAHAHTRTRTHSLTHTYMAHKHHSRNHNHRAQSQAELLQITIHDIQYSSQHHMHIY